MDGEKKKILSFWQDKRLRRICYALKDAGYAVGIAGCTLPAGMPAGTGLYPDWEKALRESDIVLLPLPTLRGGKQIAFSEAEISFSEFLSLLHRGTVLLCGMLPKEQAEEAEAAGMRVYDYYDAESVKLRNGELTAEGAISIAMQELPIAIDEARAAVVGCGRIGNALCKKLRAMGAEVTAFARRRESLSTAEALSCHTRLLNEEALRDTVSGYDVVFTTVPSRIYTAELLRHVALLPHGRKTLYIDLSSSPGSFDPIAARESGIRLLWALSLPGKYAPDSAGQVLADQILNLLREGGEEIDEKEKDL